MDLDQLKTMMAGVVPLNRHLGIEIADLQAGTAVPTLPEAPHLLNHVGTQHAAALFAVAEAASGAAVVGALADVITTATPLARSAQITYLKPAHGPITASARLDCDAAEMSVKLEADGKADVAVAVDLTDVQGVKVAQVGVAWYVRKNG
jgi:acyl-coenzyme A thioesterase PaaI-like protein